MVQYRMSEKVSVFKTFHEFSSVFHKHHTKFFSESNHWIRLWITHHLLNTQRLFTDAIITFIQTWNNRGSAKGTSLSEQWINYSKHEQELTHHQYRCGVIHSSELLTFGAILFCCFSLVDAAHTPNDYCLLRQDLSSRPFKTNHLSFPNIIQLFRIN